MYSFCSLDPSGGVMAQTVCLPKQKKKKKRKTTPFKKKPIFSSAPL
jgi:cyclopropane fatty-acyl-phospholipid synthase-like methyltransferase